MLKDYHCNINHIRNFSIIAHIDHGKSTIADRLLEYTGTIPEREKKEQILDDMDLERERGITIKSKAVRLYYHSKDGKEYILNLIDTPGHVDFYYEVSRSLAACEGALLIIDASQGVQAQTLSNIHLAVKNNLKIIPIINKIDLANANPEKVIQELKNIPELKEEKVILASAKEGIGTSDIFEAIVNRIPPPSGKPNLPLRALIFDSVYNSYKGTIVYIKMVDGIIKPGMVIQTMSTKKNYEVTEIGIFRPKMQPIKTLTAGEVGYLIAGFKNIKDIRVGDTITDTVNPAQKILSGYKKVTPLVFCSIYPIDNKEYENLKIALEKLKLNDSSIFSEPETSQALGFGFRCGFLGLLHMEIVQERLEREYNINLIATAPSVMYKITKKNGGIIEISNPTAFPSKMEIEKIEEPYVKASIITPSQYIGVIMDLVQEKRGFFKNMEYIDEKIAKLDYDLPLNEIILDFFDKLKSRSSGYASLDYELKGYQVAELVKVDILVNHEFVDALSFIVHKVKAYQQARKIVEKLKEIIPRQLYEVPIQASIEQKVIARETIKALKKDVLAKCYGGDITRKRKLLEKQKAGKKRMKKIGRVEIPQEAFLGILKID
ncbi:MAG: elongation factor 4 [Candidatus Infernicultor aquiphilus]|uniref:Elongation factor 4 n=1 Tax=Candidatus Infernicultor aquiphilus TaxID=1805029 RepID=A0A1J5G688_9BACT|nr:elongation factor 4 [bacterium]OIP67739.1 MAG: elongation factor 4 [Candidatus Atribacteria bacterium CG2_30_33_13]PIU25348.1 MAG: elongation factor 4 [Candidatus Atribacteria bacterium CG08_land_8_20_14_0_20_33_29]PIW12114.1 MAG: elongation factor 4 [Candidatus Atribacteria bacterium CG17_big_fil_post_rev_8_21_14_2_50_34_11]PIX34637.1 MAG: elongation factor 4 [Candidatus Atribacteria bacterium CG_4_8_14_3_um_filter_34_18]PIY33096.1 MAG: elongation factor 4 [Candidatus Atribacteria bacteriu